VLRQRILTALVLVPLVIAGILLLPSYHFSLLLVVVVALASWEWASLMGIDQRLARMAYVLVQGMFLPLAMHVYEWAPTLFLGGALVWWVSAMTWIARSDGQERETATMSLLFLGLAGVLVLQPMWVALVVLHINGMLGAQLMLFMMVLVWGADSGAYFAGRRWGRARLAPLVSPGKTWEGVYGALATTLFLATAGVWWFGFSGSVALGFLFLSVVTVMFSIVGDLFESLAKRRRGVKDSGQLLPGHGGILDRIDSLTAAAPVFCFGLDVAGIDFMIGITVLGATGTIGINTLDVIGLHSERFRVVALTANRDIERMRILCLKWQPEFAVMADCQAAAQLEASLSDTGIDTQVLGGDDALAEVAALEQVDFVMAAIVGAAGLIPTLSAARAGKRILLANKEALVMSGDLFMNEVKAHGACLLPIDSEHNAVFQCLPEKGGQDLSSQGVARILLTSSGGPFRNDSLDRLANVTPEQACAHPNWVMGRKISVDSATMMNKGLEVIEASHLFSIPTTGIQIVVHPESIIHSMVEYRDGSVLAQMASPDMRVPIAHALAWPDRLDSGADRLDLFDVARLNFEPPDPERFPCIRFAYEALNAGGTAPAVLNAANEVAVEAFLERHLPFTGIPEVIDGTLASSSLVSAPDLKTVLAADNEARRIANVLVKRYS